MPTDNMKMAKDAEAAMVPSTQPKELTPIETLAARDAAHAPVDRAKRALGLPK